MSNGFTLSPVPGAIVAAGGRPGMSDAQVANFVACYMPAYEAFRPALYAAALAGGVGGKPTMLVRVDASRNPIHT